jgi:hypothetical protein
MFTFALLRRKAREDPKNWRHLGFLPSQDFAPSKKGSLSPEKKLQQYHDYMLVLLEEVKTASEVRPKMWVNLGGTWRKMRLRILLSVVSGNQKSQDYLCGWKASNNGSAGSVHRGCMASAVYATAVGPGRVLHRGCQKPQTQVLRRLNDLALMDVSDVAKSGQICQVHQLLPVNSCNKQLEKRHALELFRHVQKLSIGILGSIFTMHAHCNAFDGINFGANEHGILVATAEDHLHSFESGVMLNLSEVAYGRLTDMERNELECTIRMTVRGCSSSVLAEYPRGTLKTDFGKLTNCSHKEKVGSVFYLLIGLHMQ